jgi:hypothetical protein
MKKSLVIKPLLLAVSFILAFMFLLVGIGMEEFFEISGNALIL